MPPSAFPDSREILVGVDFSADSEAALVWAADFASALGCRLHVLHVAHDPADDPGFYRRESGGEPVRLEEIAKRMLDEFLDGVRSHCAALAEIDVSSHVTVGLPETRILEYAGEVDARLVVLGGQGQNALIDTLLGSRAERVVRHAKIPVAVVRASESGAERVD